MEAVKWSLMTSSTWLIEVSYWSVGSVRVRMSCSLPSFSTTDKWVNAKITSLTESVFLGSGMCSRLLSFTSLLISSSCFLRPPGFTVAPPPPRHQHGALLPAVPLGAVSRHPMSHFSPHLASLTVAAHTVRSLTHCPPVAPWLHLPYLLVPSCLCPAPMAAPLSPGPGGADRAPDYLCAAASVLCSD